MSLVIRADDPRTDEVGALLAQQLAFASQVTPAGHVHALDIDALTDPTVTFFSVRRDGVLVAIGALKELASDHGELKSMHTVEGFRGQGVGRALVDHLLAVAIDRQYRQVSLETGTMDAFAPARSLYTSTGFRPCEPFGPYTANPHSTCMTIELDPAGRTPRSDG